MPEVTNEEFTTELGKTNWFANAAKACCDIVQNRNQPDPGLVAAVHESDVKPIVQRLRAQREEEKQAA